MPPSARPDNAQPLGNQLLADHLRSDAAAREASVARFNSVVCIVFFFAATGLGPLQGWPRSFAVMVLCSVYSVYFGVLARVLKRGWFHPAICWFNVCLENSAGGWLFAFDILYGDAGQALSNPVAVLWSAIIVLAAVRSKRKLAIFAGSFVAVQMGLLYFLVALPRLAEPLPLMFSPPLMTLRAFYYFITGWMAVLVSDHLTRKAEDALRAIRARDLLGKYFLHERLGVGGMAEVFRATYSPEGGFEKVVAIKRILPAYVEDEDFVTLFRREAELGSLLNHPNIIQVFDVGRFQDTYFMAMEHIEGLSLRELLRNHGPLPCSVVAYLGAELGEALDYVHRRTSNEGIALNLVHRDVNPPNILLSRIGEVKLGDFGVARAAIHVRLTEADRVRGKLGYMAPEQARGEAFDGRADLFALGLTLHEALTGKRVFQGDAATHTMRSSPPAFFKPPSAFRPDVPPLLDATIMELLQWNPVNRTPRGQRLREQLRGLTGSLAPYPHGQELLARLIQDVMARMRAKAPERMAEPMNPMVYESSLGNSEEETAVVLTDPKATSTVQEMSPKRGARGE